MQNAYTCTITSFPLFGHGQELRQIVLQIFEDAVKSYLLVQNNTKQERGDQQPSITEKSIAELVATQLEHLCHYASVPTVSEAMIIQKN